MLKTVLTLCLFSLLSLVCFGQTESNQTKVIFKANTEFSVQLDTAVYTESNNVGDDVKFVLTEDLIGDGVKVEKGSVIFARIVNIQKISPKSDTAKACIMFDFVKNGVDFMSLVASIVLINPNAEDIKLSASPMFTGGTTLSLKGKEIQLDKGRTFRVKLIKDITAN